jgi:hypothetical protein
MSSDSTGTAPVHAEVQPAPPKGLLLLVKSLGLVLVLLFLGLIAGIIWKATHKNPTLPVADLVFELGVDPAAVRLLQLDGNLLALTTDKEIVVVDVAKRKVLLRSVKP